MNQEQFDALVAQLEHEAERNPGRYKLKLGALASLGYLYILGVLLLLGAIVVGLVYWLVADGSGSLAVAKILIPVLILIALVVKALWVKLEPPRGFPLKASERPRLFALVEEVRAAAKAPRAHEVLMTNELNAAIVQIPRLGLLGWQKNYLILGLPLMQLMTLDEFKAVLAHEFGHLSGAHGRFGAWIYRVRASWARLNQRLQQEQHWGSFLFVPFFGWFAPTFAAWSFVQARTQEYEADRVAASAVGAKPLTNALIRLSLKGRELDQEYWPRIYANAEELPAPADSPFTRLAGHECRGFLPSAAEHLKQELTRETDTADTHPCLSDRIQTLRQPVGIPPPVEQSAAEILFGGALPFITEHFDEQWRDNVAGWWSARHEHIRCGREQLATYRERPRESLSDDELFKYAELTEEFESKEKAYPLYFALAKRPSSPVRARFAVGRLLLAKGDDRGKKLIDKIMTEDVAAVMPGCELIIRYLQEVGRHDQAQTYAERYRQAQNAAAQADEARYTIKASDDYVAGTLSQSSLAAVREALSQQTRVKRAYVAEKLMPEGQARLFVVGVEPKSKALESDARQADRELVQALAGSVVIPEDTLFIPLNQSNSRFKRVLSRLEGAKIYG